MAAILFSKCPWQWQLFRNKMLEQIRDHWYKPPYPFCSVILIVLIKKLIKLSWNRFPVWGILWKNGSHFEQNGHHFLCRHQNVSEPLLILTERSIMAHIAIILSENNLSDIIIEEIVCRNTCFECNYNIWITFYIFLWNYESIKVGVQLVFNTIWDWHHFTAVIWKNDTKSFIFTQYFFYYDVG
jgi:hypothetical protein